MYFGFSLSLSFHHSMYYSYFIHLVSMLLDLTNLTALLKKKKHMQYKNIYLSILFGVVVYKREPPVCSSAHQFLG
jgi:hypothetical protein